MSTKTAVAPSTAARVRNEGYAPGACPGPDLKAALADVSPRTAFWRPGPGRHSVAEIALHHAWCVRSVIDRLTADDPEPFVLPGADWVAAGEDCCALSEGGPLAWPEIASLVERYQTRLAAVVADIGAGRTKSPLSERERFDLILGITCHAIYHAGQVQLVKALQAGAGST